MARSLGGDHKHINFRFWLNLLIVHIETMCKRESSAVANIVSDMIAVDFRLMLIRRQHHDKVCQANCFVDLAYFQTRFFSFLRRLRTLTQANHDVDTGILQVVGMGVALRAITNNGNRLVLNDRKICIFVVIHLHGGLRQGGVD